MNGILCINKPANMTSFDVCAKIKRQFKAKVGHTGTLDPMATGVMVVVLGNHTKLVPYLTSTKKTYQATCRLGIKTDTGDIWGKVIEEATVPEVTEEQIQHVLNQFLGETMQIPPMVSAIKVDGKKLYEYAREGKTLNVSARLITIEHILLTSMSTDEFSFEVTVSAGTYIRTLCEDIGKQLNTVATMSALSRTGSGVVTLDMCQPLEEALQQPHWHQPLPLLSNLKQIEIDDPTFVYHGKRYHATMDESLICFVYQNQPLAIYKKENETTYKSERGLW